MRGVQAYSTTPPIRVEPDGGGGSVHIKCRSHATFGLPRFPVDAHSDRIDWNSGGWGWMEVGVDCSLLFRANVLYRRIIRYLG